jgi:hypothetical protein
MAVQMNATGGELPMAAVGCTLAEGDLDEQVLRYRRLGAATTSIERRELGLTVRFESNVELALLEQTIAVERGCCSYLTIDYDTSERSLSISVDGPERIDVLDLIGSALRGASWPSDAL